MPITRTNLCITFSVPSKGAPSSFPSQSTQRERCFVSRALFQLSIRVPCERTPLIIYPSLKVPSKWAPRPCSLIGSLWREKLHLQSQWFIHLFISVRVPTKQPSYEKRENIRSPSMEPHADGRPTYNMELPGSTRGLFTTLLSLPQCHAAYITISSTLAWVHQSPVSQRM